MMSKLVAGAFAAVLLVSGNAFAEGGEYDSNGMGSESEAVLPEQGASDVTEEAVLPEEGEAVTAETTIPADQQPEHGMEGDMGGMEESGDMGGDSM